MFFHYANRFSCFFQNVFSEVLSVLRPCSNVNCEGKRCDNGKEAAPANPPDDPKSLDSAAFVTQETDEVIHSQTQRMQTEVCMNTLFFYAGVSLLLLFKFKTVFSILLQEEECHWNMETLNIVQEEGITTAYGNFKALNFEIHML